MNGYKKGNDMEILKWVWDFGLGFCFRIIRYLVGN